MEESAQKRRERIKAMRNEASLAGGILQEDVAAEGSPVLATPSDTTPTLTSNTYLQYDTPPRVPRFQYYTDPLASFTGSSQKKKKKLNNHTYSPPSPLRRENVCHSLTSNTPPGCFHTPIPIPDYQVIRGKVDPCATAPGKIISSGSANYSGNTTSGSNDYVGTPQPSPASHHFDGGGSGSGGYVNNSARTYHNSLGSGRNSWNPGRSGGRGSQKFGYSEQSAVKNPDRFFSMSMLEDPWKDLGPIQMESQEIRSTACSVPASSQQD